MKPSVSQQITSDVSGFPCCCRHIQGGRGWSPHTKTPYETPSTEANIIRRRRRPRDASRDELPRISYKARLLWRAMADTEQEISAVDTVRLLVSCQHRDAAGAELDESRDATLRGKLARTLAEDLKGPGRLEALSGLNALLSGGEGSDSF